MNHEVNKKHLSHSKSYFQLCIHVHSFVHESPITSTFLLHLPVITQRIFKDFRAEEKTKSYSFTHPVAMSSAGLARFDSRGKLNTQAEEKLHV